MRLGGGILSALGICDAPSTKAESEIWLVSIGLLEIENMENLTFFFFNLDVDSFIDSDPSRRCLAWCDERAYNKAITQDTGLTVRVSSLICKGDFEDYSLQYQSLVVLGLRGGELYSRAARV